MLQVSDKIACLTSPTDNTTLQVAEKVKQWSTCNMYEQLIFCNANVVIKVKSQ